MKLSSPYLISESILGVYSQYIMKINSGWIVRQRQIHKIDNK